MMKFAILLAVVAAASAQNYAYSAMATPYAYSGYPYAYSGYPYAYSGIPYTYSAIAPAYATTPVAKAVFPATASVVAAPAVVAGPALVKTQYHAQDPLSGSASYGHIEPGQTHQAIQDAAGNKVGSFSHVLPDGSISRTDYVADAMGYRVASNSLPVSPAFVPAPVADTPEVAAARAAHLAEVAAVKSRSKRAIAYSAAPLTYTTAAAPLAYSNYAAPVAYKAAYTPAYYGSSYYGSAYYGAPALSSYGAPALSSYYY